MQQPWRVGGEEESFVFNGHVFQRHCQNWTIAWQKQGNRLSASICRLTAPPSGGDVAKSRIITSSPLPPSNPALLNDWWWNFPAWCTAQCLLSPKSIALFSLVKFPKTTGSLWLQNTACVGRGADVIAPFSGPLTTQRGAVVCNLQRPQRYTTLRGPKNNLHKLVFPHVFSWWHNRCVCVCPVSPDVC